MKTKLSFFLLFVATMLFVASCGSMDPVPSGRDTWSVSPTSVTLNAAGDEQKVAVTGAYGSQAMYIPTTAISHWFSVRTVKDEKAEGRYTLVFSAEANTTGKDREYPVIVTDGLSMATINLKQLAK